MLLLVMACRETTEPVTYPSRQTSTGVRAFGPTRILVIPAMWSNSPPSPLTPQAIQQYLFGAAPRGHLRRLYLDASNGAFELTGDVAPWVRTAVATNDGGPGNLASTRFGDHLIEAINLTDARLNFGRYDNDGPDGQPNSGDDDGFVDGGVVFVHSELNFICPTGRDPHPHAAGLSLKDNGGPVPTQDAARNGGFISIRRYTIMSATDCTANQPGYGIMAHELGHVLLGMPDLYHIVGGGTRLWEGRRWTVGCWELMAGGAWGCGRGAPTDHAPASAFGAWVRSEAGWVTPTEVPVDRDATYELRPIGFGGTVLRIPVTASEHFLVEYREQSGVDADLAASGVLIYRIRPNLSVLPQTPEASAAREYRVMLIEADADSGLTRTESTGGNRGVGTDVFNAQRSTFSAETHPDARASTGEALPFAITEIQIDPTRHRATLRVVPRP